VSYLAGYAMLRRPRWARNAAVIWWSMAGIVGLQQLCKHVNCMQNSLI